VLPEGDAYPATEANDWCGAHTPLTISQINERAKASEDSATAEG